MGPGTVSRVGAMGATQILRRLTTALPGIFLVAALAVSLYDVGGIASGLQNRVSDAYQQAKPRATTPGGESAVYIDIDRASMEKLGHWPWPRTKLADLIEATQAAGATAILLDIPLPGPDQTSPGEAMANWSAENDFLLQADLYSLAKSLPNHDAELARAFAQTKLVTSFAPGKGLIPPGATEHPAIKAPLALSGGNAAHYAPRFERWRPTLEELETAAAGNGASLPDHASLAPVRALPLLTVLNNTLLPATILEAVRLAKSATGYRVTVGETENGFALGVEPGIKTIALTGTRQTVHTDLNGNLRLYYGAPGSGLQVPAWQVLANYPRKNQLKDRIAIIGLSANGSERLFDVPTGERLASGAILANAIDQIIDGAYLTRPEWAGTTEQAALLVSAILIIFILIKHRFLLAFAFTVTLITIAIATSWWFFQDRLWLLDPAYYAAALFLIYGATAMLTRLRVEADTRFLESQFARRLSSPALSRVLGNPGLIPVKGTQHEVSSLICGLRSFNIIADRYLDDPETYALILNRFFTPMTKIVLDRNGMVDRYVADTLMAIWNAPLSEAKHASMACDAALRMVENLEDLNDFLEEDARKQHLPYVPLSLSVGIDSGLAITGNMGASQRFDYGVLGEPVSFASYLQRNAQSYGPAIIVGEDTQKSVNDRYALLEIDFVSTARAAQGRHVYALLGDPIMRANPKFRALVEAHQMIFAAYRKQRWNEARAAITQCRKLSGAIPTLYDLYESRISLYEADPPGDDWNGAWFAGRI